MALAKAREAGARLSGAGEEPWVAAAAAAAYQPLPTHTLLVKTIRVPCSCQSAPTSPALPGQIFVCSRQPAGEIPFGTATARGVRQALAHCMPGYLGMHEESGVVGGLLRCCGGSLGRRRGLRRPRAPLERIALADVSRA